MRRLGKKTVAAGGAAVLGAGVLVGLSTLAWGDLPEAPPSDTPEFRELLAGACGSTKGEVEGIKKYRWHTGKGKNWSPVEADGCEFTVKSERIEHNVHTKYPGDWRLANVWNCGQTSGNTVSRMIQNQKGDEYETNWSVGLSVEAGLFDIFSVGFQASTGGAYRAGTWTWEATTLQVSPGYVGWLEASQDLRVVSGDFKLNFPHTLRDHYFWYLQNYEVKTPTGEGTQFAQFRALTDAEIRANCPGWDWSKPDPRKEGGQDNRIIGNTGDTPHDGGQNTGDTPANVAPTNVAPTNVAPTSGGGQNAGAPAPAEWKPQASYSLGDKVTFDGVVYECLRAHQADAGWQPTKTPELWRRL